MDIAIATYKLMMRQKYTQLMKRVRAVEGDCYAWGCYVRGA